jgi:hypothetical protein
MQNVLSYWKRLSINIRHSKPQQMSVARHSAAADREDNYLEVRWREGKTPRSDSFNTSKEIPTSTVQEPTEPVRM